MTISKQTTEAQATVDGYARRLHEIEQEVADLGTERAEVIRSMAGEDGEVAATARSRAAAIAARRRELQDEAEGINDLKREADIALRAAQRADRASAARAAAIALNAKVDRHAKAVADVAAAVKALAKTFAEEERLRLEVINDYGALHGENVADGLTGNGWALRRLVAALATAGLPALRPTGAPFTLQDAVDYVQQQTSVMHRFRTRLEDAA